MPGDLPGWKVTFHDDFSGNEVDDGKWGRYDGVPSGQPEGLWMREHAVVRDGRLLLQTYSDGGRLASGGVSSARAGSQTYGRWDIRFRIDGGDGVGYAILLYPADGGWPPEIDIAEDGGGWRQGTQSTLHYGESNTQMHAGVTANFTSWHTVSVIWTKGRVEYRLDGRTYGVHSTSHVPSEPMWLGMQTQKRTCSAQYRNCPGGQPPQWVNMEVDWVVRWQATGDPTSTAGARPSAGPTKVTGKPATVSLRWSRHADRRASKTLGGSTLDAERLDGKAYIWARTSRPVKQVRFYVDDPERTRAPARVETYAPYDLSGGQWSAANHLDLWKLSHGTHRVTAVAVAFDGSSSVATATFRR